MVKFEKPHAFYELFERKGGAQKTTHYCPGCGHGSVHKMIAEAIDEFAIQDRVIFCSPVGCSVFGYYYFDTGNIQCAHGRAPAVATAMRRVNPESIIISYQGDGDLAGIGTAEIIHAANRGENITVFFVNNAIYGMTGGQMAPTTLVGQRTMTTPAGRSESVDGGPIGMAEVISAIQTPVYVERVSLADGKRTMRARKAIRKALRNQIEKRGFSFVEILSPCPINWKMTATEARRWIIEELEPVFPLQRFKDEPDANTPELPPRFLDDQELIAVLSSQHDLESAEPDLTLPQQRIRIAGFGGQGVLSAGVLLANCAITSGLHATWLPSYGPEMRGGTANASVIVSGEEIGSPLVEHPTTLIAMNGPSLEAFQESVVPGGLIVVNSSIAAVEERRTDVRYLEVPASDMAQEAGILAAANVVMLAAYAQLEGFPAVETLRSVIPHSLKRKHLVEKNLALLEQAIAFVSERSEAASQPAGQS